MRIRDYLLTAVLLIVQLGGSTAANRNQVDTTPLDWFGYLVLVIGPLALLWRRRYPTAVLLIVLAATAAYGLRGYGNGPIFLSLVVAFFTAAITGSRWRTYPLLPLGYLVFVWPLPVLLGNPTPSWWAALGIFAWLSVVAAIAEGIRQRRAAVEARRQREATAQISAEQERLRRASEERLAIARELHDVLAHSLSLINVQSSVALELLERKPEQAGTALAAIKAASKEALGEVHALLDSLRAGAETAPTAPAPSIAEVDALVARARAAGLDVTTQVTGPVRRLPSVVDVAAARIVQESLTNVARHAPGAHAVVSVTYAPESVRLRVDDNGSGTAAPASGGGNGIPGMIERAHALGGKLSAGARADGGFRVEAVLPISAAEVSEA